MAATSVTGRGLGAANSSYKPNNNWRTYSPEENVISISKKSGCKIIHNNCSIIANKAISKSINFKTCG